MAVQQRTRSSHQAERRAQQLIAASYALLVVYIGVEATRDLAGSHHPEVIWVGIGLAAFTAPTMPLLARAKRNVGRELNSSATVSEASQNMICAYLSIALLVGLLANAIFGCGGPTRPPRSSSPRSLPGKASRAGAARGATAAD